ncbi:cytochrome P450 [Melanogaster broomeanus]|nr:cytochrome P450 [Melanogaster broomeanus]
MALATANWTALCVTVLVCVIVVDVGRRRGKNQTPRFPHPLPPGPPPLPIVGNIRGINVNAPWLTYSEWSRVYGDLVYSRFFNQNIIIINSEKIAKDLLEDRSSNYSNRPDIVTTALFGIDFNTVTLPYGDRWRLQRRFFYQSLRADSVSRFVPLESPELYIDHLFHVYDYDPLPTNDHVVDIIGRVIKLVAAVVTPEVAAILGAFPIILTIPSWFPGMGIKRKGALCREWAKDWVEVPFKHALQRMNDGSTAPSMVFDALRKAEQEERRPGMAAATAFAAGSETSSGVLATFLLAMVLNPEIQEKAHAQVEAVVGKGRLPTLDDRPSLTYIDAYYARNVAMESCSVPHAVVNDDVYDGYHIPKGATVLTNIWFEHVVLARFRQCRTTNPNIPKPFEFIPERFLNLDGTLTSDDVLNITFGHGRRMCAGRHFADVTLWSAMSLILALFKLSAPKDEHGNEVSFEPGWTSGITSIVSRVPGMDANMLEELIDANA